MTDKLMPTEREDRLPAGFGEPEGGLGIPGLGGSSLGGGAGSFAGTGTGPGSKVSGQVVLAAVVLALAGGAIYGMRFIGLNAAFGGEEVKVDYTSSNSLPETAKRFTKVMNELDASMAAMQVPNSDAIPAAPFSRPKAAVEEPVVFAEPENLDDLDRMARMAAEQRRLEREERMALIQNELMRLQVQSVLGGRVPAARINGQPVTVGKMLGVFQVVEISDGAVYVEADGNRYELRIGMEPKLVP